MGLTVTFQINLETENLYSCKQPYHMVVGTTTQGDAPVGNAATSEPGGFSAEAYNFKYTRSTWLPDMFRDNYDLKNGNTFVAHDSEALYLINNYTSSTTTYRKNPPLTVVSQVVT